MRAARMYGYKQPLKLEEIPVPDIIALAETEGIKDSLTEVRFDDVNDHIDALAPGDFVGRAVIVYD